MICSLKTYCQVIKSIVLLALFANTVNIKTYSQDQHVADSLARVYQTKQLPDSLKLALLVDLSFNELRDNKQALQYANELISLSRKSGNANYLGAGYLLKGSRERQLGQLDAALASYIESAELAKKQKNVKAEGDAYSAIADIYSVAKNHITAGIYYRQAIATLRTTNDSLSLAAALFNAGDEMLKIRNDDSAFIYLAEAKEIYEAINYSTGIGYCLGNLGILNAYNGNSIQAEKNINASIKILEANHDYYPVCDYLLAIADVYKDKNQFQEAIAYATRSLLLAQQFKLVEQVSNACQDLSSLYQLTGNAGQSLHFYKLFVEYRDSLNNLETVQKMADLRTDFEVSQKQGEVNLLTTQKKTQQNLLLALAMIAVLAILIVLLLVKSNRHRKKAYTILSDQKHQTEVERTKAENALTELRKTQNLLIQSAKMASMGELTAGIAHEIQNPLNFVNNFSEINKELILEMKVQMEKGDYEEAKIIANYIQDNDEKINNHGKRADAIVKGMLQHSRSSSGQKEPTRINTLCEEYLRLSYHGLRAKDKSFNVILKTDFDETVGNINIIPQDIGRVILNVFNNAFYSVDEKKKAGVEGYEPSVSISTRKFDGKVEIKVTDNGIGIPEKVLEKIFQPFFTTKPTGQGTGLGLSLSYDIVKANGGELKVETKDGEYAEFIITLPV